jgi:hypothetical protein
MRLLARMISVFDIIFLSSTLGIFLYSSYQTASARCSPEDIENGVYCGPNQSVEQPQIGNSGTPLITNNFGGLVMAIIIAAIIAGGAAIFVFTKTRRIAAKA